MRPNSKPTAPSENAAGYPSNKNKTSARNIIGAMFWMKKASIQDPRPTIFLALFDCLDDVFDFRFERMNLRLMWIWNETSHDGDALDQFRNGLDQQQAKADHDQRFCRPLR